MGNLFSYGRIVSVITNSGEIFVGTFLGIRYPDDCNQQGIPFFYIQLTTAVGPYAVGEIVALNLTLVTSIGPVTP